MSGQEIKKLLQRIQLIKDKSTQRLFDARLLEQELFICSFVEIRDRRAQRKAAFENSDVDDKILQEDIEGILLQHLADSGLESIKTAAGTAYKSMKTSASIADWDIFLEYVKANDAWELLTRGCAKTSVVEYKKETSQLPPGINWREELTIGVRRATSEEKVPNEEASEPLRGKMDLMEKLLSHSPERKQELKENQPELYRSMQWYEALKNQGLLSRLSQQTNQQLASQEEITTFKPMSSDRMALHQKPLGGNPGLSLEEIRERINR